MKKNFFIFVIAILIILVILLSLNTPRALDLANVIAIESDYTSTKEDTNYVEMVINDSGVVLIELFPETAPITVQNFKSLVSKNYYDDVSFHRIIDGFMVQGGDGDSTPTIYGEFESNGFVNELTHTIGTLSMARTDDPDSASGQFFICLTDEGCAHLDGEYASFGVVIEGMDVISRMGSLETDENDKPYEKIKITSVEFIEIKE